MALILNTERMRVVERNERGNVTYRKRYKKGDEVDVSHMDEAHVERLKESGVLVASEDDLSEPVAAGSLPPSSGPFGAATTGSGDPTVPEDEQVVADGSAEVSDPDADPDNHTGGGAPVDEGDGETVSRYDSMDYSELQAEAKSRDLRYVGVGADDLRASLKADDES